MNGAPAKPISGTSPASSRDTSRSASSTKGTSVSGIADAQRVEVGGAAHGMVDHRTGVLCKAEADAHTLERQEDVGEDDGGIELEAGQWLKGDLGGHLGPTAHLDEAQALADRPVLGQVAAGLTHEPDRRSVDRFAEAGVEQSLGHMDRLRSRSRSAGRHVLYSPNGACEVVGAARV